MTSKQRPDKMIHNSISVVCE